MRTILGIAAALTLVATVAPTAAQAQYYDQGYSRYDNDRSYGDYHGHDWRERQRWERRRERDERRAHRRWEREHRGYHRDQDYYPYR
jgi:hypothetical protein